MRHLTVLAAVVGLSACGSSHRLAVPARDSALPESADTSDPDASAAEAVPACAATQFQGTINRMSFADALRTALAAQAGSGVWAMSVVVSGAQDTQGLECFDGLITDLQFVACGGPLRIRALPRQTLSVDTSQDCPVVEISGLAGVGNVHLSDASGVGDFSPLVGAASVGIGGYPSLALIAPYAQQAQVLELSVRASSLAPLNDAQATQAKLNVRGTTSLADYQPAALTCFSIQLEDLDDQAEAAAIAPLCTPARDGRQCPTYRGCLNDSL